MAEALYRKYRPQVFEDVVGQDHIERTLKNALGQDQVSHAYLFCGPRGTGKTTTARLLAKALLCEHGPTPNPDGTCRECVDIANGVHPDVYELDAASRTGVENVRDEIIGRVNFAPTRGSKKIYIIDEVHMLSTAAFNALLKTLEEPPDHVVFILCTTDPQKVPETIQSRCQRFDFHRLSNDEIVARLGAICVAEDVEFEGDALDLIAHRAEGGMRNALTSLEQLIAFGEGSVTVKGAEDLLGSLDVSDMAEIIAAVGKRDVAACFTWTANYVETGADLAQFARDMAEHVRNMYVLSLAGTDAALDISDAVRRELTEELALFGPDRLARLLGVLGDVISDLRTATNPRLCFEIALTRMVRPDSDLTMESLAERVEALEAGQSAAATRPASAAGAAAAERVPAASSSAVAQAVPVPPARSAIAGSSNVAQPVGNPQSDAASRPRNTQPASSQTSASAPEHAASSGAASSQADAATRTNQAETTIRPATGGLSDTFANPAALQRLWRSVVVAVKKEKVSYGVLFVNVKVRPDATGAGLTIEFPIDNSFAYTMACKSEVQEVLRGAFQQVAGVPVPFVCVQGQEPADPKATKIQAAAPSGNSMPSADARPAIQNHVQVQPTVSVTHTAASAPASQPFSGDDRVPLDAYDGIAESYDSDRDDSDAPVAEPSAAPAVSGAAPGSEQPTVAAGKQAGQAADASGADDMNKVLSDTMGITFEEVDE